MSGELTPTSVILQSRLTQGRELVDGDLPGALGVARFEIARDAGFGRFRRTEWMTASADSDYLVKTKVDGLEPGTRYFYRLRYGVDKENTRVGRTCSLRTLDGARQSSPYSFVVVTGMNYAFFHYGRDLRGERMYPGADRALGYPALSAILRVQPDFFVGTGDNVYYDHPIPTRARTPAEIRRKYHEQFIQQRYVDLFAQVSTYWEKDDHDYRYNDSDPHSPVHGGHETDEDRSDPKLAVQPSHELGIRMFHEQLPVVDPRAKNPVTYRTHRVSRDLQVWFVEGRDYRSPNLMEDGPGKTLWGAQQITWLKRTLLESKAAFKVIISPTPLVGPDGRGKRDSHVNLNGFRHEAGEFFGWLTENGFLKKHVYFICGDRHWQYHAVHPSGFEEFSSGALCDANSVSAKLPGDPKTTDPEGKIEHRYSQIEPSGGFLRVALTPGDIESPARLDFSFYDERGKLLYRTRKEMKR